MSLERANVKDPWSYTNADLLNMITQVRNALGGGAEPSATKANQETQIANQDLLFSLLSNRMNYSTTELQQTMIGWLQAIQSAVSNNPTSALATQNTLSELSDLVSKETTQDSILSRLNVTFTLLENQILNNLISITNNTGYINQDTVNIASYLSPASTQLAKNDTLTSVLQALGNTGILGKDSSLQGILTALGNTGILGKDSSLQSILTALGNTGILGKDSSLQNILTALNTQISSLNQKISGAFSLTGAQSFTIDTAGCKGVILEITTGATVATITASINGGTFRPYVLWRNSTQTYVSTIPLSTSDFYDSQLNRNIPSLIRINNTANTTAGNYQLIK